MKAGCPVISTNSSSIPEVAGDAAILVDNIEQDSFVKSIKYLENKNLRNKLINKGFLQAEKFSWNLCYKQTREFYNEVNNWKSEK
jgi:mannosyltransferase